jgi:hypothetical protein
MPNYRLREWILSLVTSSERATTIVGDMAEEGYGTFRCWMAIASHIAHALTPRMIVLGLAGFLVQFLISALPMLLLTRFLWVPFDEHSFRTMHLSNVVAFTGTQILAGYWIGRWSRRRSLLPLVFVVLLDLTAGAFGNNSVNINMAIWTIPLLSGAVVYRRFRHA